MSETSENSSDEQQKQKEPIKKGEVPPGMQKICGVCGDRALGYNFNAISCESCKAFFRRNAVTSKDLKCPFNNACNISVLTRRFCQKCRLEKCFAIGMVKEYIMSNEDKADKRKKIEMNRAKKRTRGGNDTNTSSKQSKRDDNESSSPIEFGSYQAPYEMANSDTSSPVATNYGSPMQSSYDYSHRTDYSSYQAYYPERIDSKQQEPYGVVPDSRMFPDQPSENTIRSILTSKPETAASETARHAHDACDTPSTSYQDTNKARDILEDVERRQSTTTPSYR